MTSPSIARAAAPLARVALARNLPRMLALPALLVLAGAGVGGLGVLLISGTPGVAITALGVVAAAIGVWLAVRILSLHLAVEVDYLHLTGIGTDRRYHLAPGPLSRLATGGPSGTTLRTGIGGLARGVGSAALSATEQLEVIRLGATPSVILVPTERGRLAVAVSAEADFIESLMAAGRKRAETPAPPPPAATPPMTAATDLPVARPLTGIERMQLEERLAVDRREALTAARAEHAAAGFSATAAALAAAGATVAAMTPAAAAALPASLAPAPRVTPLRRPARLVPRGVARPTVTPSLLLVVAPLLGVVAIWALAVLTGTPPAPSGLDPLLTAILLCGPIAAVAIWQAQGRWPRLAGLTSVATLVAIVLVTRAVLG